MFSRLPYCIPVPMQIDIVYGLLDRRIRKRVTRESVSVGLDCLLERARYVEESLSEVSNKQNSITCKQSNYYSKQNNYIPNADTLHTANPSPAFLTKITSSGIESFNPPMVTSADINPLSAAASFSSNLVATSKPKRNRPRCLACKRFGHTKEGCRSKPPPARKAELSSFSYKQNPVQCYGCGKPGTIRSRCDTCNANNNNNCKTNNDVQFHSVKCECADRSHPMVRIEIAGRVGVAVLDTGATHSIASPGLYSILADYGVQFEETRRSVGLADGTQQVRKALICKTTVVLRGRSIPTTLLVLPGADNRTPLGRDFIVRANLTLDLAQATWCFADAPEQTYPYVESYTLCTPEPPPADAGGAAVLMHINTPDVTLRENEGCKLTPPQKVQLNRLIVSRADRFASNGPPTSYATHHIRVDDAQEPIASPPYRLSQSRKEILDKELQGLLQADIIEECESPWAANVVLVAKKNGSMRLCVDYRKINAATESDRYPLPRIEDVLHAAKTTCYMTTLDLQSGYYPVSVADEDRDKTAFVTPFGTFRFKRMPMGLRNSGATFQRLIDRLKSNLFVTKNSSRMATNPESSSHLQDGTRPVAVLAYLDDIIVLSETFEQHLEDLEAVFDRLALFNLRVNRKKSCFARDTVKFLGHIIVPGGLLADPDKTSSIADMPPPKNVRQLKSFLAMSSWFRRFVSRLRRQTLN